MHTNAQNREKWRHIFESTNTNITIKTRSSNTNTDISFSPPWALWPRRQLNSCKRELARPPNINNAFYITSVLSILSCLHRQNTHESHFPNRVAHTTAGGAHQLACQYSSVPLNQNTIPYIAVKNGIENQDAPCSWHCCRRRHPAAAERIPRDPPKRHTSAPSIRPAERQCLN